MLNVIPKSKKILIYVNYIKKYQKGNKKPHGRRSGCGVLTDGTAGSVSLLIIYILPEGRLLRGGLDVVKAEKILDESQIFIGTPD